MVKQWLKLVCALALVGTLAGCSSKVTLAVPDMMCEDGCAAKVREVLSKQPGVKAVNVNFPKRIATIAFDKDAFSVDDAVAVLVDHGFEHSKLKTDNAPVTPTNRTQPAMVVQPSTSGN